MVKILAPSPLIAEAAEVLASFREQVVVVGAAAVEVALADSKAAITPTRDVDVVVPVEHAAAIIADLEAAGLRRSEIAHESQFTWVRGDLKVQLVRTFHPFPPAAAKPLPQNPVFGMAAEPAHQVAVAFEGRPEVLRLRCANAACLLALKQAAFGRTRVGSTTPVQRDYHDAFLLIHAVPDGVAAELRVAGHEIQERARRAIDELATNDTATVAAGREMVRLAGAGSQREAEAAVRRVAIRMRHRLDAGT